MKRLFGAFVLLAVILALAGCDSPAKTEIAIPTDTPLIVLPLDAQGKLAVNSVMREGPGFSFKELGQLPQGTSVHIVGTSSAIDWYEVRYKGAQGTTLGAWIPVEAVTLDVPGSSPPTQATSPLQAVTTLTSTPTVLVAINTPTFTRTSTPELVAINTETFTPTFMPGTAGAPDYSTVPVSGNGNVRLVYDPASAALINISGSPISVSGLEFVRVDFQGNPTAAFNAELWTGVTGKATALPPGDCLMVNSRKTTRPAECASAWGFITTSQEKLYFWLQTSDSSQFQVWKDNNLLQTCEIPAGSCEFYLP